MLNAECSVKIWIIGGTGDSAAVIKAIANVTNNYIVTVTTPEASLLYDSACPVVMGKMDLAAMAQFCDAYSIKGIVDASHPFAVTVSQNAIAASQNLNLPYIRYERGQINAENSFLQQELDSFATLLQGNYLLNQRVLLTVGCNPLPLFKPWQKRATLFARILPKPTSLEIALDSGFKSDRLIALRPPLSEALEVALWQQWQISLVVTKASGKSGGEEIKRQVAKRLGIPLITIARPEIEYPQQTCDVQEIVLFCRSIVNG
jgi:precorrin-6A/cobalt-precorrin-6A reductase